MAPYYAPGKYRCTVLEQGWAESTNGNDMLVFKVRVEAYIIEGYGESGELVHQEQMVENAYTRTLRITFTNDSIEMALKKLRYAGFSGASFDELNLVGSRIIAVSQEPRVRDGKTYEQWDLALPPMDSGPPLQSKPGVARKLNALFGKQLKASGSGSPTQRPATAAVGAGSAGSGDDDIPF